ncbi:MAG: YopX family protein [bacterium]
MREIEFRGKGQDGKWHYGNLITVVYRGGWARGIQYGSGIEDDISLYTEHISNYETIGQYTGFYDKNSEKVYEDDYMRDPQGNLFKVVYAPDLGCWLGDYGRSDFEFDIHNAKKCVKVGNFHDDKELNLIENA